MIIQANYGQFNEDLRALQHMFSDLPKEAADYLYSEMFWGAANPVVKAAKASPGFNDITGRLRKSIRRVRRDVYVDVGTGGQRFVKGGAASAAMGGRGARHVFLIEKGTIFRYQETTGRFTGRVSPRRVLERAFEQNTQHSLNEALNAGRKRFTQFANAALNNFKLNKRALGFLARV